MAKRVEPRGRRRFLKLALAGAAVPAGGALLSRLAYAADLPHVDESDPTAVSLGYKNDTAQVDQSKFPKHEASQRCAQCRYFQGSGGGEWAPCLIFPGKAVHAGGWCSAYSAK